MNHEDGSDLQTPSLELESRSEPDAQEPPTPSPSASLSSASLPTAVEPKVKKQRAKKPAGKKSYVKTCAACKAYMEKTGRSYHRSKCPDCAILRYDSNVESQLRMLNNKIAKLAAPGIKLMKKAKAMPRPWLQEWEIDLMVAEEKRAAKEANGDDDDSVVSDEDAPEASKAVKAAPSPLDKMTEEQRAQLKKKWEEWKEWDKRQAEHEATKLAFVQAVMRKYDEVTKAKGELIFKQKPEERSQSPSA